MREHGVLFDSRLATEELLTRHLGICTLSLYLASSLCKKFGCITYCALPIIDCVLKSCPLIFYFDLLIRANNSGKLCLAKFDDSAIK